MGQVRVWKLIDPLNNLAEVLKTDLFISMPIALRLHFAARV
jgi:hypothetical protein